MSLRQALPLLFGLVLDLAAPFSAAQSATQSATPLAYSMTLVSNMTEVSMFSGRESNVTVHRNGSREMVEVTLAPQPGNPQSVRMRYLFDFEAHKAYTLDLDTNSCSWMRYVSADAPLNYDPITGSAAMLAQTSQPKPKDMRPEAVNGIPARREEFVMAGQGTTRLWIAEKGNFIVKLEAFGPNGKRMMYMEVKQLSYARPQDSLLAAPPDCATQTQGEWSDTGVNAPGGMKVEAEASGTADLSANRSRGAAAVRSYNPPAPQPARAGGMGATSPTGSRVTEVRLRMVPDHYTGPCPGHIQLVAEITTDGPGTVWYQFLAGAVSRSPEGTLTFNAAGTQTVTIDGTFRMPPRVPQASVIAIMEDGQGNHGPRNISSGPVNYNIACTGTPSPSN